MSEIYEDAEIYLTSCTHPDYKQIRYLGLDTKKDPNYLGSSVVLKWWIQLLGRRFFKKVILTKVTGTMSHLCSVEQRYILEHDAVKNPFYFNMNGGKARDSIETHPLDLEYSFSPTTDATHSFLNSICQKLGAKGINMSKNSRDFISRVVSLGVYGFLQYEQSEFRYSAYSNYGGLQSAYVNTILSTMVAIEIIDLKGGYIELTQNFIDSIPDDVYHTHYRSNGHKQ